MHYYPTRSWRISKCLFEPKTHVSDSLTYDITAWSLPYIYGLEAFATEATLDIDIEHQIKRQIRTLIQRRSLWLLSKMGYNQWIKVSSGYIKNN
ncbi:hypothetical protein Ct9H90mP29_00250 [bacterium]|nr:MAG: hypothetical protein Ct9H90mP29_00250 [bacterium]